MGKVTRVKYIKSKLFFQKYRVPKIIPKVPRERKELLPLLAVVLENDQSILFFVFFSLGNRLCLLCVYTVEIFLLHAFFRKVCYIKVCTTRVRTGISQLFKILLPSLFLQP
ncbi:uncharacterized protein TM35_000062770 [Trypanosoma theileri]|uniref:Uncharacterized protein n=1 Tax=Trypanosoma theileri TaxID=67003 RepID=A0A1X0P2Y0_9TRYP|nr:uncharacterized protein TM35_000062770 [Trypanosoma theileri]ORC91272.1 hypothetical protein TM35_000062770 [Trypanosoma theileri]